MQSECVGKYRSVVFHSRCTVMRVICLMWSFVFANESWRWGTGEKGAGEKNAIVSKWFGIKARQESESRKSKAGKASDKLRGWKEVGKKWRKINPGAERSRGWKKIQEDIREGWGSEGGLFDLDWWYLISTVITIPMALHVPVLISLLHSGNASLVHQYLNLQERGFWHSKKHIKPKHWTQWKRENKEPQTENTGSALPRVLSVHLEVLVCRLLVFLNISYQVSESEKTVLQLAPGHQ